MAKLIRPRTRVDRRAALRRAARTVISPDGHQDEDRLHAAFRLLREEAPVAWVEAEGVRPFWLLSRYADVVAVERRGAPFVAAPRSVLSSEAGEAGMRRVSGRAEVLRSLFQMDGAEHRAYRAIALPWFTPSGLRRLEPLIERHAEAVVARAVGHGADFDFAAAVAVPFPSRIMMHMLGLPERDDAALARLTRGIMGAEDPHRQLSDSAAESMRLAGVALRDYFDRVTLDRRRERTGDLSDAIANARIEGSHLPDYERLSYFIQLAIAGQENASFCISGGMHALIEHPAELAKLKARPALLDAAVEEIFRWTTPGRHLVRTAVRDAEVGGQRIRAGEAVALFFCSANRDEAMFESADAFVVDRTPNPHIAFGLGAHYCLGAELARLELRAIFRALLARLGGVDMSGAPRRARSAVISGIDYLPVRFDWVPGAGCARTTARRGPAGLRDAGGGGGPPIERCGGAPAYAAAEPRRPPRPVEAEASRAAAPAILSPGRRRQRRGDGGETAGRPTPPPRPTPRAGGTPRQSDGSRSGDAGCDS